MNKISAEVTMGFDVEKDKDLFEQYSPISLLLASEVVPTDGFVKMEEMIKYGKTYRITLEEIE